MNLILSTTVLSFLLFVGVLVDQETNTIKRIDSNYRISKSMSDFYKLEALVQKFIKVFPKSDRIFWRMGRTYFKLGEKSNAKSEKARYFLLCIEYSGKTLKINPMSAHGYFFNGLCNGSLGQVQGLWSSLGKIKPFKKDMETAISIDPSVNEGGPHRALANLYLQLPFFLGGDLDRSIIHFKEAVRLGPEFGENYLGLAEAYIQNEDFLLARETLQAILEIKPGTQKDESISEWHTEASSSLQKIAGQIDSESYAKRIKNK